jgi:hypothetical protein
VIAARMATTGSFRAEAAREPPVIPPTEPLALGISLEIPDAGMAFSTVLAKRARIFLRMAKLMEREIWRGNTHLVQLDGN